MLVVLLVTTVHSRLSILFFVHPYQYVPSSLIRHWVYVTKYSNVEIPRNCVRRDVYNVPLLITISEKLLVQYYM